MVSPELLPELLSPELQVPPLRVDFTGFPTGLPGPAPTPPAALTEIQQSSVVPPGFHRTTRLRPFGSVGTSQMMYLGVVFNLR
jgi:hypothetical protein